MGHAKDYPDLDSMASALFRKDLHQIIISAVGKNTSAGCTTDWIEIFDLFGGPCCSSTLSDDDSIAEPSTTVEVSYDGTKDTIVSSGVEGRNESSVSASSRRRNVQSQGFKMAGLKRFKRWSGRAADGHV
jgi:hypothetical protein